ncbi:7819_t:CDS:2 [Ambispora leptoticha]|uniref:7819_t:CDS:1 n=1 Tax=Ambispora leptoticha TaxID=144679 RepID=A0A9N9CIP8_9GLOM|nr:7819_t:CDS:2 [Ambispora leptoticha]
MNVYQFEGVCSLRDIDLDKWDEQVSTEEIEMNLQKLKWNLDPEASQVISIDSEIIWCLSVEVEDEYKYYMGLVKHMERSTPLCIRDVCNKFVMSYNNTMYEEVPIELSHRSWNESEEDLVGVVFGILNIIESVWKNPAFGKKFAKSQNEETYVMNIIVPVVKASLKNYQ